MPRQEDVRAQIRAGGYRLVSCRIDAAQDVLAGFLLNLGFDEIEQLATFESGGLSRREMPVGIRAGGSETAGACAEIAARSFAFDRFHADAHVSKSKADALKAAWADNNARGRADLNLVAFDDGEVVGFNQCILRDGVAVIDLIAVSANAQRRGFGRALVEAAFAAYQGKARRIRVGTQVSNRASMLLYQRCGMSQVGLSRTFHLWA